MKHLEARCGKTEKITVVSLAHSMIAPYCVKAVNIVDATAGKGYDTLFLAQNMSSTANLYSFDIQDKAIKATASLLEFYGYNKNIQLINDSHTNMQKYVSGIDLAIFNLGYLPGNDKTIKTVRETTLQAVDVTIELLNSNGVMLIVAYPGHKEGNEETIALNDYLPSLPQKEFTVISIKMENWCNAPPQIFFVKKECN